MNIDLEQIKSERTREYFKEVYKCFSEENYRFAIVQLYTLVICDLLYKLQELKDLYSDKAAIEILKEVEKAQEEEKKSSKWEKKLLDRVCEKTQILGVVARTNINHLFDHRNLCAHPALNEDYNLFIPNKKIVSAHISNMMHSCFYRPALFSFDITDRLSEELSARKEHFKNDFEGLQTFLHSRYLCHLSDLKFQQVFKNFWKFVFRTSDEKCDENRYINSRLLIIMIIERKEDVLSYIGSNQGMFQVSDENSYNLYLCYLCSRFKGLYSVLEIAIKKQVENYVSSGEPLICSWYLNEEDKVKHLKYLKENKIEEFRNISKRAIGHIIDRFEEDGVIAELIDFFIYYFSESVNFNMTSLRYSRFIEPILEKCEIKHFEKLIEAINNNDQIYKYGGIRPINNNIMQTCCTKFGYLTDISSYPNFDYDEDSIEYNQNDWSDESEDDRYPF